MANRLGAMSWSLCLMLLSAPLAAQVTARPWGLIGIQLTGIQPGTGLTAGQLSPDGQIYITGGKTDFPWTAPTKILGDVSHNSTFVLKVDPSGKTVFEVQIGGSLAIGAPAFDSAGNSYVVGNAADSGFATTPGAYQSSATAHYTAFVCKLSATDGSPVYCTFLPGDVLRQAATDSAGNLYFVGRLGASASTTPGALNQGSRSISIGKLDSTGTKLIYQAAFGGSYVDYLSFMTVDASGDVYLAGRTYSADFPVTANAVVPVFPGKNLPPDSLPFASYVLKLNPTGSALLYSTYGGLNESPLGMALDPANNVQVLVGTLPSQQVPVAFYVRRYNADASAILFETNLGVPDVHQDNPPVMAIDSSGVTDLFGVTSAVNFPLSHPTQSCGYTQFGQPSANGYLLRLGPSGSIIQSTFLQGSGVPIPLWLVATPGSASLGVWSSFPYASHQYNLQLEVLNIGPNPNGTEVNLFCIGNAASLLGAPLAPYEIVSLFGRGLGPAQPVTGQPGSDNRFPSSLGGTQVMFDGIPAPLLYVSDNQINAVTPSGLAAKASTQVCIVFQGSQTNCIYAGIALASPGVFLSGVPTNNPTPFAAAVNQDGTVNSAQHPASVGSIVSIYATGLGMITPAPTDGAAISLPLPANVLPVQVLFTDPNFHDPLPLLDTVLYAGPAPFEVVGLTQINVPATAAVTLQVTLPDGTAVQDRRVQIWIK